MELDAVGLSAVRIISLNEPLAADIPDVNSLVLTAGGDASAVRVELHRVDARVVIAKSVNDLARSKVKQLHGSVVGAGGNESRIRRKVACKHAIVMSAK